MMNLPWNIHTSQIHIRVVSADVFARQIEGKYTNICTYFPISSYTSTHTPYNIQSYSHTTIYIAAHLIENPDDPKHQCVYSVKIHKLLLFDGKPNKQFKIIDID